MRSIIALLAATAAVMSNAADTAVYRGNASRLCRTGPPKRVPSDGSPNVLVVGDSVSIGWTPHLAPMITGAQVQHSPDSGDGGALDTAYSRGCNSTLSRLTDQTSSGWDVIVFNSGLHDICYDGQYPEECVGPQDFQANLAALRDFWTARGPRPGVPAKLVWVTTTPVPCSAEKTADVVHYNEIAAGVFPGVPIANTFQYVIDVCGPVPYTSCNISNTSPSRCSPHYTSDGYQALASHIAPAVNGAVAAALADAGARDAPAAAAVVPAAGDAVPCAGSVNNAACPSGWSCMPVSWDTSKVGCCEHGGGTYCGDDWHCCPAGTKCAADCSLHGCDCLQA